MWYMILIIVSIPVIFCGVAFIKTYRSGFKKEDWLDAPLTKEDEDWMNAPLTKEEKESADKASQATMEWK